MATYKIGPLKSRHETTENPIFWEDLKEEHRVRRATLYSLISGHIYKEAGQYVVPVDDLFFGTITLADDILEYIINKYNFKRPKDIIVRVPRYEKGSNTYVLKNVLEQYDGSESCYLKGESKIDGVLITETRKEFIINIWPKS